MPLTILSGNPTGSFEELQDSAVKTGNPMIYNIPAPASLSGAANTLTAAQVINGIVVVNNAAVATTLTLCTAPALAAALRGIFSSRGVIPGDTIEVYVGNGGTALLTLSVSGATGMSFDPGSGTTVTAGTSRILWVRFTSGAIGSETAVIFT